jgi:hypothetical protein
MLSRALYRVIALQTLSFSPAPTCVNLQRLPKIYSILLGHSDKTTPAESPL